MTIPGHREKDSSIDSDKNKGLKLPGCKSIVVPQISHVKPVRFVLFYTESS